MGKFIDRQKLEAHFSPAIMGKEAYTAGEVLLSIQKFPSADVAPVIHAHWARSYKRPGVYEFIGWYCTNCNSRTSEEYAPYWWLYCPHCGAKMDEEVEDA